MKKFLAVLAVAGFLTACNDNAGSADNRSDSIENAAEGVKDRLDESANNAGTATENAIDSAKNKIDSSADAKKEQLDSAHTGANH